MDFSEQLADQKSEEDIGSSEGASLLQNVQESESIEEEKRQNGKFQSAYDGSGLSNDGPSMGDYDYEAEFNKGNSFKADDAGGVNLSNSNVKEATTDVGGFDLKTGKRYTNQWSDQDGRIEASMLELQKSNVNSKTGTPPDDMLPLSGIGLSILNDGGTYEEFVTSTQGLPWTDKQRATSWEAGKQAKQTTEDVKDYGSRIWKESTAEPTKDIDLPVTEGIDESELKTDAGWVQSSTTVLEALTPGSTTGMTSEEISDASLELMSDFNWNIPSMMSTTAQIVNSGDPDLAKSFLHLMKQNDATDVTWDNTGRAAMSTITDLTIWATLGGSVLVSRVAGAAMRVGVRKLLTKVATVTALDTTMGATAGAVTDISKQAIEGAAGERDELDQSQVAKTAAMSAGVTAVLGVGSATVADPVLRKFGIQAMRKGANNLRGGTAKPSGGPAAQRGAIGVDRTPKQVEFRSRLNEQMDSAFGKKGSIKVQHLQNTVKSWVKKGLVKQEEVDWAGINLLDSGGSVSREEIRAFVDYNRPVPQLNPVAEVRHDLSSLGNPEGGYREIVISVDKVGDFAGPEAHFGGITPEGQANVGHLRLATSKAGGKRGTMLLEGQSDIRKAFSTQTHSTTGKAIKQNKVDKAFTAANKTYLTVKTDSDEYIISMMEKYGLDPTDGWSEQKAYAEMSHEERSKATALIQKEINAMSRAEDAELQVMAARSNEKRRVPFTPFRDKRKSNELLFRSAVMDAMNDGSEFLSWPSATDQIQKIEGWPGEVSYKSVLGFYQKDLPKIAEAYGFKVEKHIPDEFKGGKYRPVSVSVPENKEDIAINKEFYRVVFSPEDKKKWQEGGAAMYGFGAAVGIGAISQDRDEGGRFK